MKQQLHKKFSHGQSFLVNEWLSIPFLQLLQTRLSINFFLKKLISPFAKSSQRKLSKSTYANLAHIFYTAVILILITAPTFAKSSQDSKPIEKSAAIDENQATKNLSLEKSAITPLETDPSKAEVDKQDKSSIVKGIKNEIGKIIGLKDSNSKKTSDEAKITTDSIKDSIDNLFFNETHKSLMFHEKQNSNIQQALKAFKSGQVFIPDGYQPKVEEETLATDPEDVSGLSFLHLSTIVYLGPKSWTLWINDKKYSHTKNDPTKEIYIAKIDANSAKILWRLPQSKYKILTGKKTLSPEDLAKVSEGVVKRQFLLMPNQSYNLATDEVSEGLIRGSSAVSSSLEGGGNKDNPNPLAGQPFLSDVGTSKSGSDPNLKSNIEGKIRDLVTTKDEKGQSQ